MKFTLTYEEGNEVDRPETPMGFDTIQDAKYWCTETVDTGSEKIIDSLPFYIFSITEWDNLEQHEDFHNIVAQCNFEEVAEENWEDLSKAINY